jgi:hypothetical protein
MEKMPEHRDKTRVVPAGTRGGIIAMSQMKRAVRNGFI